MLACNNDVVFPAARVFCGTWCWVIPVVFDILVSVLAYEVNGCVLLSFDHVALKVPCVYIGFSITWQYFGISIPCYQGVPEACMRLCFISVGNRPVHFSVLA